MVRNPVKNGALTRAKGALVGPRSRRAAEGETLAIRTPLAGFASQDALNREVLPGSFTQKN
jgi:hypothetical protein